jgi:hypothetical protein
MTFVLRLIVLFQLLSACVAFAQTQWDGWDYKFDREITPWAEMQAQIPPYPADANLLPLDVGSATPHRFFIDAKSVSVGQDGVVRYTLVIKTAGGATNVSFEGIRCDPREQKYYAIGRTDRTWVRARNPQWRPIQPRDYSAQHNTLHREYFCRGKIMVETVEQILQTLRRGPERPPTVD